MSQTRVATAVEFFPLPTLARRLPLPTLARMLKCGPSFHCFLSRLPLTVAPLPEPTPLDALPEETRSALESAFAARAEVIRLQASAQLGPEDDYTLDLQLPSSDSLRMKRMKRDLLRLEAAIPMEAMDESFQR